MGTAINMAFGGATLAACPLSALVLSFAFYGFCGWAWESTVCAMLNHGRFANSGFLLGPCCPIYGAGGIACWLLLRGIPDASSQFVAAALVCSVIEYSVGVLLEKTTGARFWDYSHLPFNLHGRICLYWACAFGLGALCICRLVEPALLAPPVRSAGARSGRPCRPHQRIACRCVRLYARTYSRFGNRFGGTDAHP